MALDAARAKAVGDNLYFAVAPLFDKPARDLTEAEAYAILGYLQSQGEIGLYDPAKSKDVPRGQMKVATSMAGVEFWHASGNNGASKFGSVGAYKDASFQPTPAFAVVLYRLAVRLSDQWGATKIVWGGVGHGSGKNAHDCHMAGHCLDFYGATTRRGGTFDVKRDWYLRPVYLKDGKPHPTAGQTGFDRDRWGNDTHTSYRLVTKIAPQPPLVEAGLAFAATLADALLPESQDDYNPRAKDFFLDVYRFISEQCAFGPNDISPAAFKSGSPLKAGYTLHPDYPTQQRRPHNDHIHFQLGSAY